MFIKKYAPVENSSGRKNIHPPVENCRRQQKEVVPGNFLLRAYVFFNRYCSFSTYFFYVPILKIKKNYKNTILHLTDFRIRYILLFAVADESDSKIQFFDRIGKERIEQVRFYERRR